MQMTDNTILITGGGSGIGKGLAEAFHKLGNKVIIAGRRADALETVTKANPGMMSLTVDMTDRTGIEVFARQLISQYPALNVVINNAGIMRIEDLRAAPQSLDDAEAMIATNLTGPIRLTQALLPHLLQQARAALLTLSSGLAFVPMTATPTYCATKAAIHSYSMSLRRQLKDTPVEVIEIAPPYVQTELIMPEQAHDPRAMPLDDFISEVMGLLGERSHPEIIVENCKPMRYAAENGKVEELSDMFDAMF